MKISAGLGKMKDWVSGWHEELEALREQGRGRMSGVDFFQSCRRELKYIVSERQASAIRDLVGCYLDPDPYSIPYGDRGYPICSLYLDTPTLALYDQTMQGLKNRFKLRVRFYDDEAGHPAFVEIKRRETVAVRKLRATVTREGAREILANHPPSLRHLRSARPSPDAVQALWEFCRLRDVCHARPTTYVYYRRDALISSEDGGVRVTFDRDLQGGIYRVGTGLAVPHLTREPDMGGVILEFKFTNRFPNWMQEIASVFNLQTQSVPKYVKCVDALRIPEHGLEHLSFSSHERLV